MGLTGGCACGTVRYRMMSEPFDTGWCHCRTCQLVSGAPAMAFTTVLARDFRFEAGEEAIGTFRSSSFGHRQYCRSCGTCLTIHVEYQPDWIDVAAATLDQPDAVTPGFHIFWGSKVSWFNPGDGLPRYEKFRPIRLGSREPSRRSEP
jgi:hypothetical protein